MCIYNMFSYITTVIIILRGGKMKNRLLDDVEKIYFSIPCSSAVSCEHCKNKLLCDLTANLLKSLKKLY